MKFERTDRTESAKDTREEDASADRAFIVKYKNEAFNLKEFLHKHPGGIGTLGALKNCDLTSVLDAASPHSEAAFYLMKEYKVKLDCNNNYECKGEVFGEGKDQTTSQATGTTNGIHSQRRSANGTKVSNGGNGYTTKSSRSSSNEHVHKKDQAAGLRFDKDYLFRDNGATGDDARLEHLVDWNRAMVPQIGAIGEAYAQWVNLPVDRELRLFGPWYLECLTKTPWWLVPLFWIPSISLMLAHECSTNRRLQENMISTVLLNYFGGILLWTLLEYILHRYLFHMDGNKFGPWGRTFHFLLHGLHHKVPFDPYRLVFPPVPAIILASVLYQPLHFLFPNPRLVLAGGLTGYLIYDMIHYYLHYGNPSIKHFYHMKRYHYQHHFVHHDKGFGISSPLWDHVFQTGIQLKKLKLRLKW